MSTASPPVPTLPPRRKLLRALALLVPLGVAANIGVALATTDRALLDMLREVSWEPVVLATGLAVFPWFTQALRIAIWTRFVGHPVSIVAGVRIAAGGVLGSAITPTAVGGGSIRWALTTRYGLPPGKAASLLAVEAVEDVVFFALALPLAAWLSAPSESELLRRVGGEVWHRLGGGIWSVAVLASAVAVTVVGMRLAGRGRLGARAQRLVGRLRGPLRLFRRDARATAGLVARRGKRWFALSLVCTGLQWTARYSMAAIVIAALGGPLRPFLYWVLGWLTYVVASGAPTPGAAGATEAAFLLLHAPFVPASMLVITTALWRLMMFYVPALIAAVVYPALRPLAQPPE
ncbi:MAG: lysylphosphatidylglycerol synthase transmembrane domain-containing protein [Bacteroidota bacterium]